MDHHHTRSGLATRALLRPRYRPGPRRRHRRDHPRTPQGAHRKRQNPHCSSGRCTAEQDSTCCATASSSDNTTIERASEPLALQSHRLPKQGCVTHHKRILMASTSSFGLATLAVGAIPSPRLVLMPSASGLVSQPSKKSCSATRTPSSYALDVGLGLVTMANEEPKPKWFLCPRCRAWSRNEDIHLEARQGHCSYALDVGLGLVTLPGFRAL